MRRVLPLTLLCLGLFPACGEGPEDLSSEDTLAASWRDAQSNVAPLLGIFTNGDSKTAGTFEELVLNRHGQFSRRLRLTYQEPYWENGVKKLRDTIMIRRQQGTFKQFKLLTGLSLQGPYLVLFPNVEQDYLPSMGENAKVEIYLYSFVSSTAQLKLQRLKLVPCNVALCSKLVSAFAMKGDLREPCIQDKDCTRMSPRPAFQACQAASATCVPRGAAGLITKEQDTALDLMFEAEEDLDQAMAEGLYSWGEARTLACYPAVDVRRALRKVSHSAAGQQCLASAVPGAAGEAAAAGCLKALADQELKSSQPIQWTCSEDFQCVQYCPRALP